MPASSTKLVSLAILGLALATGCAPSPVNFSPELARLDRPTNNLYDELTAGIGKAKIHLLIAMHEGAIQLDSRSTLSIPANTRAIADFEVVDHRIVAAGVSFTRPVAIHAEHIADFVFQRVRSDSFGHIDLVDLHFSNVPLSDVVSLALSPAAREVIRSRLVLNSDPYGVLHGQLFYHAPASDRPAPSVAAAQKAGSAPIEARPSQAAAPIAAAPAADQAPKAANRSMPQLIQSMTFSVSDATLDEGAVLQLGTRRDSGDGHTRLEAAAGATLQISRGSFEPETSRLDVVARLDLPTRDSTLATRCGTFHLATGSRLRFDQLHVQRDGTTWRFDAAGGSADLKLHNTHLSVDGCEFDLDEQSAFAMDRLELHGGSNQPVELKGHGQADLAFAGGSIRFTNNILQLAAGSRARLDANLSPGNRPGQSRLDGKIQTVDLHLQGGELHLGDAVSATLAQGSRITGHDLSLDTAARWKLAGLLDEADLQLADGSVKSRAGSVLQLGPGSHVILTDCRLAPELPHCTANLAVDVDLAGGSISLPGGGALSVEAGSHLTAQHLTLRAPANRPLGGVLDQVTLKCNDGRVHLPRGFELLNLGGSISLDSVVLPTESAECSGSGSVDVHFASGDWNLGATAVQLKSGHLAGHVQWADKDAGPTLTVLPSALTGTTSLQWTGSDAHPAATVPSASIAVESGQFIADAKGLASASGRLHLQGTSLITLDHSFVYDLHQANCSPNTLSLQLHILPGWSVGGPFVFARGDRSATTLSLLPTAGHPIRMELDNRSANEGGSIPGARIFHKETGQPHRPNHAVIDIFWAPQNNLPLRIDGFALDLSGTALKLRGHVNMEGDVKAASRCNPLGQAMLNLKLIGGSVLGHDLKTEIDQKVSEQINRKLAETSFTLK